MARSIWKGPFVDGYLLKKADAAFGGDVAFLGVNMFLSGLHSYGEL